jgi:hypothetical protein
MSIGLDRQNMAAAPLPQNAEEQGISMQQALGDGGFLAGGCRLPAEGCGLWFVECGLLLVAWFDLEALLAV